MDIPVKGGTDMKDGSHQFHSCYRCIGFIKIDAWSLSKTFGDNVGFMSANLSVFVQLVLEHEF